MHNGFFVFVFLKHSSEILPWGGDLVFAKVSHMWPSHVLIRLEKKKSLQKKTTPKPD